MMDLGELSGKGSIYHHLPVAEAYLSANKDDYKPPPIPVSIPDYSDVAKTIIFGHQSKELFIMDKEYTNLNRGARGSTLKQSLQVSHDYQRYMDSQPMRVKDRELVPLLCHVIREVADFVKCDPRDLFLTNNVHSGVNTILNSLVFKPGDKILTLSCGYGGVNLAVEALCERTGATHHRVQIEMPITDTKQILDVVEKNMTDDVKLAIFDHIPPGCPILMPIRELASMCRNRGIMVMIDAAHSLGQLDIAIESYGADFYVTNCHKWFSNTRGSALVYVRREMQHLIHPLVVSWGHGKGFTAEFAFSGTHYYSQYVSLLSTLNFWRVVGCDVIWKYCRDTLSQAVEMLCTRWEVEPSYADHQINMMRLVRLPDKLNDKEWNPVDNKPLLVTNCLAIDYNIEVKVKHMGDTLYIRLSCHIYNEMSDYEELSDAVLDICDKRESLINHESCFISMS